MSQHADEQKSNRQADDSQSTTTPRIPRHGWRIPKYTITPGEVIEVEIGWNARVVHVGEQSFGFSPDLERESDVTIWIQVPVDLDTLKPIESTPRVFGVIGTGAPIDSHSTYCGTAICNGGRLVWHVIELRDPYEMKLAIERTRMKKKFAEDIYRSGR